MPKTTTTQGGGCIVADGKALTVVSIPAENPADFIVCPDCLAGGVKHICDFCQYGLLSDVHDEVVECTECHAWYVLEQELPR